MQGMAQVLRLGVGSHCVPIRSHPFDSQLALIALQVLQSALAVRSVLNGPSAGAILGGGAAYRRRARPTPDVTCRTHSEKATTCRLLMGVEAIGVERIGRLVILNLS